MAASCAMVSQEARHKAFSASLARLDLLLGQEGSQLSLDAKTLRRLGEAFDMAYSSARSEAEWLSVLKRARKASAEGDSDRWVISAARAIADKPDSALLRAASVQAYLRRNMPGKALALFGSVLSPDSRPSLWAEAFLAAHQQKGQAFSLPPAKAEDYLRFAEVASFPDAYQGAAALSLMEGSKSQASLMLEKAMAAGSRPAAALLWDSGLYSSLSSMPDTGLGWRDLAVMADGSWRSASPMLAMQRWHRSIALNPSGSYKSYVKLALVSTGELSQTYWARLKAAFLSAPASEEADGALAAYASQLSREGEDAQAMTLLHNRSQTGSRLSTRLAILTIAIGGKTRPEAKMASLYENLVAERPGDMEALAAALREFTRRGLFDEAAILAESEAARSPSLSYGWYYRAEIEAARGNFAKAIALLSSESGQSPEALFALGSLYWTTGNIAQAGKHYALAVSASGSPEESPEARALRLCSTYKALGRCLAASDQTGAAAQAFSSAHQIRPEDAEAAMLARKSAFSDSK